MSVHDDERSRRREWSGHDQADLALAVAVHRGLSMVVAGLSQWIAARREADRLVRPDAPPEAGSVAPLVPPRRRR